MAGTYDRLLLSEKDDKGACSKLLDALHSTLTKGDWQSEMHKLRILQLCISGVDFASLETRQVQELVAHDCFLGAVRAFEYSFCAIGRFLMDCTRKHIQQEVRLQSRSYTNARRLINIKPSC